MSAPTAKARPKPTRPPATLSRYDFTPKKISRNETTIDV